VSPGSGYIDAAYFLPAIGAAGGFLVLQGWYSAHGPPHRAVTARLRLDGREIRFPCEDPRPDVAAADPRLSPRAGFDVALRLAAAPAEARVQVEFLAAGSPCETIAAAIADPVWEVEARADFLPPLRLRKLRNLILNERERLSHATDVTALPVTGQIDPSFGCNLRCPMCQSHMIREQGYRLANLKLDQLRAILDRYGDTLVRIWLSLWGEPLLNKQLAEAVRLCKAHDIWVLISSNMSVRLDDAAVAALVASGLDTIVLSLDGATQATYQEYRREGDLALALENIRRIVAHKRRTGSATPHLFWRYLEFPWNRHEIDAARALAAEVGVDEFGVEPGVLMDQRTYSLAPRGRARGQPVAPALLEAWRSRAAVRAGAHRYFGCDYLYSAISINSSGLVHPCCYVVAPGDAVGEADAPVARLRNAPPLRAARAAFAAVAEGKDGPVRAHPPCASCPVIESCEGHVVTQTSFRQLFDHLVYGTGIRW
jgi:MoaA/NifB/PqqE/SkfB family radical SAM enzyme